VKLREWEELHRKSFIDLFSFSSDITNHNCIKSCLRGLSNSTRPKFWKPQFVHPIKTFQIIIGCVIITGKWRLWQSSDCILYPITDYLLQSKCMWWKCGLFNSPPLPVYLFELLTVSFCLACSLLVLDMPTSINIPLTFCILNSVV
jgi:hypothetical protein